MNQVYYAQTMKDPTARQKRGTLPLNLPDPENAGAPPSPSSDSTARALADPPLARAVWTGQVSVGTPAQTFSIFFDSGSSDFTLASSACTTSCGTKKRYSTAASSSAVKTTKQVRTNFVDGTSSVGVVYTDTVTAGGSTATGQDIVAATSLSSTVAGLASDGCVSSLSPSCSFLCTR